MKKIFFLFILTLSTNSIARAGTGTRGGGDVDPVGMSKHQMQEFIQHQLKDQVAAYINQLDLNVVTDRELQKKLIVLKSEILKDLVSTYSLLHHCADQSGQDHDAATLNGIRGAVICFNLPRLVKAQVSSSELIALAIHEHARHFSLEDESPQHLHNAIFEFVIQDFEIMTFREQLLSSILNSAEYLRIKLEVGGAPLDHAKIVTTKISRAGSTQTCTSELVGELSFLNHQSYELTLHLDYQTKAECYFRNVNTSKITYKKLN
jgi:hypothetical protein